MLGSAGVRPSKRLGQNFLVDRRVLERIVAEVERIAPTRVLEIGAGLGTVTQELATVVERVVAVEVDRRLVELLRTRLARLPNVSIRCADIRDVDPGEVFEGDSGFVVGNIPYSITAPILRYLVSHRSTMDGALLLTQRDVAEKLAASPGRNGTALGVLVRSYAELIHVASVGCRSFLPAPEVGSSLWRMTFLSEPRFSLSGEAAFFTVVRTLYGARRKMVRRALRRILGAEEATRALADAGIDPTRRGETLTFEELDCLASAVESTAGPTSTPGR